MQQNVARISVGCVSVVREWHRLWLEMTPTEVE